MKFQVWYGSTAPEMVSATCTRTASWTAEPRGLCRTIRAAKWVARGYRRHGWETKIMEES